MERKFQAKLIGQKWSLLVSHNHKCNKRTIFQRFLRIG